jgi:hypothetical protein
MGRRFRAPARPGGAIDRRKHGNLFLGKCPGCIVGLGDLSYKIVLGKLPAVLRLTGIKEAR